MTGQQIGPYRIVRELGRGGMGAVFEGVHPQIQRKVAIKVLHPQYAQSEQLVNRFFNEARAVNIVNHPSIVQISEFAQLPDGTAYIVMEFLEGESLGQRMKRQGGKLSLLETLRLGRQIAAALAAAHQKGIIHRDLKPDNVMIVSDPEAPGGERAKVLDFGIAKAAATSTSEGDVMESASQTKTGVMVGTPLYMAPEQCKGSPHIDDKADVYSLGVMLYRMLSGRPPFMGEGSGAVMAMHIYEPPTPVREVEPSIPDDLAALIHRLLAKDPAIRPPMIQVAQALEQLKNIHGTGALSVTDLSHLSGVSRASSQFAVNPSTPIPLSSTAPQSASGPIIAISHQPSGANSVSMTLGQSAAQIEPRRRGVLFAIATISACAVLGIVIFVQVALNKRDAEDGRPSAGDGVTVVSSPRKVRWTVSTDPSGASVVRATDQRELGRTPWRSEQSAASGPVVLILRLPGYADRVITLDQSANSVVKESLQPLVVNLPAPPVATTKPVTPELVPHATPKRPFGKKPAGAAAPSEKTPATVQTPTTAPTPPPATPKEETGHARIQMVD